MLCQTRVWMQKQETGAANASCSLNTYSYNVVSQNAHGRVHVASTSQLSNLCATRGSALLSMPPNSTFMLAPISFAPTLCLLSRSSAQASQEAHLAALHAALLSRSLPGASTASQGIHRAPRPLSCRCSSLHGIAGGHGIALTLAADGCRGRCAELHSRLADHDACRLVSRGDGGGSVGQRHCMCVLHVLGPAWQRCRPSDWQHHSACTSSAAANAAQQGSGGSRLCTAGAHSV